jgi:hypothetical protein
MSSSSINIPGMPTLPIIGYYNTNDSSSCTTSTTKNNNNNNYNYNSYETLEKNLKKSCTNNGSSIENNSGIFKSSDFTNQIPPKTKSLDVPFFLAKTGLLDNNLPTAVMNSCASNQQNLVNQIQYLTCQLEESRNQVYNSADFTLMTTKSIKTIFEKFKNLKTIFVIIFIITIYLLITGFVGSMDMASNIFVCIAKRSESTIMYWVGILIGLAIPVTVLCIVFKNIVCKSISVMESYNITDNPYGEKDQKRINEINSASSFDILILVLFILLIYGFVAVLFTIKKSIFGMFLYTIIVGLILFIISIFLYVLYAYVPFFSTTDQQQIMNKSSLMLFIDNQETVSPITSNQYENMQIRKTFLITGLFIILVAILFFVNDTGISFINGILGSSAILALPILWIFNFTIGIQYFYLYPIILIGFRFIRYVIMSILYIFFHNKNTNFSSDLLDQFENFKNYSAPWGLIGVDEFKLLLNILGYENIFSKEIIEDSNSSNISLNKYVSSGFLGFIVEKIVKKENNINGIILSIFSVVISIIISMIILYGIVKI